MNDEVKYHIGLKRGDIGRYVLLPGDPGRVPKIANQLDDARQIAAHREYVTYTGSYQNVPLAVCSTGIGCPSAAIAIEELIDIGCDTFIRVGTAGSLQPDVSVGNLVVSAAAVREEGTSRQYVPLSYPALADLDVTLALRTAARRNDYPVHVGISHCKDAFYSEEADRTPLGQFHLERWETWRRARVLSTSMEAAALFVIASIRGVRAGEVVAVVGDTSGNAPVIKLVGVDQAIKCALDALVILDEELGTENRSSAPSL